MSPELRLKSIINQTITNIVGANQDSDRVEFTLENGKKISMYHCQDCCESVGVDYIEGDINDIIGTPVIEAYEDNEEPETPVWEYAPESHTWTSFTFITEKGKVVIRWLGVSNGYYSESVEISILEKVVDFYK